MANLGGTNTFGTNGSPSETVSIYALVEQRIYDTVEVYALVEQRIYDTVDVSALVEQQIEPHTVTVERWVEQRIYDTVDVSALVEQQIEQATVQPFALIEQRIYETVELSSLVEQQIVSPTLVSYCWRAGLRLDGEDVSARLTGDIRIRFAGDAAGIAEFTLKPSAGAIDTLAWIGKTVEIDYITVDSSGCDICSERKFTGVVALPVNQADDGLISFTASTDPQGLVSGMTLDQLQQLTKGLYSAHVFDDSADPWQQLQDLMSTIESSFWIDRSGIFRVFGWATSETPDHSITDPMRIADTVTVSRAEKNRLVNRVRIDFDFRFERFKQRNVAYHFRWTDTICAFLKNPFELPTREMVRSAAEGAGWDLQGGIHYVPAWDPGVYNCGRSDSGVMDVRVWGYSGIPAGYHYTGGTPLTTPQDLSPFCIGASFTLGIRWAQTVTETYSLEIKCAESIAENGERAESYGYGIEAESDASAWENDRSYLRLISASGSTGGSGISGGSLSVMPDGAVVQENGDYLFEATDGEHDGRAALDEAVQCVLAMGRTLVTGSHRLNRVSVTMLMTPMLDLGDTFYLETATETVQGVVSEIEEILGIETGSATVTPSIAIFQTGGTGIDIDTPLEIPSAPESDPLTVYPSSIHLDFHIGGETSSRDYNEEWNGYVTNYEWDETDKDRFATDPNDPKTVIYPESFRVNTLEISDSDRQAVEAQAERVYSVGIKQDLLEEIAA